MREYLQGTYLGTAPTTSPQKAPSTPGWSSLRLGDKGVLAPSLPTLLPLRHPGQVMVTDRTYSHGCTQAHVGNQLMEQSEASRVQTGNSFVFL